jgi:hypothetical protein
MIKGMHSPILQPSKRVRSAQGILYVFVLVGSSMSQEAALRLDSSDWWSYTRQEELPVPQHRERIKFPERRTV